jgi:hypothetical protein
MSDHTSGLRNTDLTAGERARLEQDPTLEAAHQADLALGRELAQLRAPPSSLVAADILTAGRRPANQPTGVFMVSLLAIAAAAALAILVPTGATRDRTTAAGAPGDVHLEAVVEGPEGNRAVVTGELMTRGERLVFRIRTGASGILTLEEVGTGTIYPRGESVWEVSSGEHVPGGASPLAWRPDTGSGDRIYRVSLCNSAGACATDELSVRWLP